MKSEDYLDFFNQNDNVVLETKEQYHNYFIQIQKAVKIYQKSVDNNVLENKYEQTAFKSFMSQLLNSLEALYQKYRFGDKMGMALDLHESGFPNFLEFKKLKADISLKNENIQKLPSEKTLKSAILNILFSKKQIPYDLLNKLALVNYYKAINEDHFFNSFTRGNLHAIPSNDTQNLYFLSWGSYDSISNKPFLYFLNFEVDHLVEEITDIEKGIKNSSVNSAPLKVMISDIEDHFKSIYPKVLKRVEVGPVYASFSSEKNEINNIINERFQNDIVLKLNVETIFSLGTDQKKWKGKKKQLFFVDESNIECMQRKCSKYDEYLIASHRLVQYLSQNKPELIKHLSLPPIIY